MIRGCLEGDVETRSLFAGIAEVASEIPEALEASDWRLVGELVGREWSLRRHLADGISVPAIESLLGIATSLGAWGGKACGAGGGGSIAIFCPEERREVIQRSLQAAGGQIIDASPSVFSLELTQVD